MKIYAGTSGFQYDHWNNGVFYPRGVKVDQLEFISTRINVLEINSSFYSIPKPDTVSSWVSRLPKRDFKLILKAPQSFTHRRWLRLRNPDSPVKPGIELLNYFVEGYLRIPPWMRGPVLVQTPERLRIDISRLQDTLAYFRDKGLRVAFEPRHHSWVDRQTYVALERYGAALVTADFGTVAIPLINTTDFLYVRRHGTNGFYDGDYSQDRLKAMLGMAKSQGAKEAYFLFNNDGHGYAPKNAIELLEIASKK